MAEDEAHQDPGGQGGVLEGLSRPGMPFPHLEEDRPQVPEEEGPARGKLGQAPEEVLGVGGARLGARRLEGKEGPPGAGDGPRAEDITASRAMRERAMNSGSRRKN